MNDLTTEQGRQAALETINSSFLNSLKEIGVNTENLSTKVWPRFIYLSIKKFGEALSIDIEYDLVSPVGVRGFNPIKQPSIAEKILLQASVVTHWEKVIQSAKEHSQRYKDLEKEIYKVNFL